MYILHTHTHHVAECHVDAAYIAYGSQYYSSIVTSIIKNHYDATVCIIL